MMGVGSFNRDCQTLYITNYQSRIQASSEDPLYLQDIYRQFMAHFGQYSIIEDINVIVSKGIAFVRFQHRCMAEFVKEVMQYSFLDDQS